MRNVLPYTNFKSFLASFAVRVEYSTTTNQEIQGTVPCSFPQHKNITAVSKAPFKDRLSDNCKSTTQSHFLMTFFSCNKWKSALAVDMSAL